MKSAGFKLKAFSAVGDSTLPDNVRQFSFEPSLKAVKDREQQKNTSSAEQAFPESVLDITYSFTHPSSWSVSGSNGQLPISNAAGQAIANFDVLQVRGAESPPLSAPVEAEVNYGHFVIEQSGDPRCASCTMHVQSLIVDSRKITSLPEFGPFPWLSWPQPVVGNTGLSGAQAPANNCRSTSHERPSSRETRC